MKKLTTLLLISLVCASIYSQNNPRMAVLPFDPVGVSDSDALTVTVLFETGLLNTGIFNIIEQNKLKEILDAQAFSISACTDDACAIEVGELLSAEQIVLGSFSKVGTEYIINAKIIDVAKGEHLRADKISFSDLSALTDSVDLLAFKMAGLTYRQGGEELIANNFSDVLITTTPPGADIYINGILKGQSPDLFSKLPMGLVRIEARKNTKYAFKDVDISEGVEEINLKLSVQHGNLFIKTDQQQIDVYVDDVNLGNIGNGLFRDIPAGERSIELISQEYYWQDIVFIEPNVSTKIEVSLLPYGFIKYQIPEDADATLTGENVSEKIRGTGEIRLLEGDYTIVYAGETYISETKNISVYRGSRLELSPELRHTTEYEDELKQKTYNTYLSDLNYLENKYDHITQPDVGTYIADISNHQTCICSSCFEFPDLEIRVANLLCDAEGKEAEYNRQTNLERLYNKKTMLESELEKYRSSNDGKQLNRVFWGLLSIASFESSLYFFYESQLLDKYINDPANITEVPSYNQQKNLYELGTYSTLGLGVISSLITIATPNKREEIIKTKEEIAKVAIDISLLEAGMQH